MKCLIKVRIIAHRSFFYYYYYFKLVLYNLVESIVCEREHCPEKEAKIELYLLPGRQLNIWLRSLSVHLLYIACKLQ